MYPKIHIFNKNTSCNSLRAQFYNSNIFHELSKISGFVYDKSKFSLMLPYSFENVKKIILICENLQVPLELSSNYKEYMDEVVLEMNELYYTNDFFEDE